MLSNGFMEETLTLALQKAMYWHQMDVQRQPTERLASAAAMMFATQSYDVLLAYFQADLSEATKKEEDDDKIAAILLLIAAALAARLGRDVATLQPGIDDALRVSLLNGGLTRYGITADIRAINAEKYLRVHGAELVKGINEVTMKEMRDVLAKGLREGVSSEELASRLMTKMDDYRLYRARRIAVTETSKAWSYAELQSAGKMEDAGYKMVKEWLLGPMHPRYDPCDHNHEEGAIPLKRPFSTGDMAPPQHPNCGCSLITYPAGGEQPWGTQVLGGLPFAPFGFDQGDQTNANR